MRQIVIPVEKNFYSKCAGTHSSSIWISIKESTTFKQGLFPPKKLIDPFYDRLSSFAEKPIRVLRAFRHFPLHVCIACE